MIYMKGSNSYFSRKIDTDVLIIGSGGAGLRCAIELFDNGVQVSIVGKSKRGGDAHTILAQEGINAALGNMDPEDSWNIHVSDTIRDGNKINDITAVDLLCKNAPNVIKELDKWGIGFHREEDGRISQRFLGAATYRRACFIGDSTGKAILETLIKQVEKRKISVYNEVYIFSLLHRNGVVNGAMGLEIISGKIIVYTCKVVVLATGGHSRIYNRNSARLSENSGNGIKLAYDLGGEFMDMEMFQFHPTGMVYPKHVEGTLVTEAVIGEGGILKNSKGERFMKKYDSERMELSSRDVVSRAIYNEIIENRGAKNGGVFLDITSRSKKYILDKLPTMFKLFNKYGGIDISKKPIEVAPTAHYSMGGILTDYKTGKTNINNLFAIGEVSSGLHGGNMLGGNSLSELLVFGKITGDYISKYIKGFKKLELEKNSLKNGFDYIYETISTEGRDPWLIRSEIEKIMWEHVGVIREESKMRKGYKKLLKYKDIKLNTGLEIKNNNNIMIALDIKSMLPTCEMVFLSAMHRKESRGAHFRSDFPKTSSSWKENIICYPSQEGIKVKTRPVSKVSREINDPILKFVDYKHEKHMYV